MPDCITPSVIAQDVLRNEHRYAFVQEAKKHESGYPYLRQVIALHHIEQNDDWNGENIDELLVDES